MSAGPTWNSAYSAAATTSRLREGLVPVTVTTTARASSASMRQRSSASSKKQSSTSSTAGRGPSAMTAPTPADSKGTEKLGPTEAATGPLRTTSDQGRPTLRAPGGGGPAGGGSVADATGGAADGRDG